MHGVSSSAEVQIFLQAKFEFFFPAHIQLMFLKPNPQGEIKNKNTILYIAGSYHLVSSSLV